MKLARILIADDEKSIRLVLKKFLTSRGYEVLEAENGREVLEILKKESVDLIFLDLKMPKLSGLKVLEKIKGIPTVVLTAYGTMDYTVKAIELGAVDYITKPFSFEEIREILKKLLIKKEDKEIGKDTTSGIVGSSKVMQEVFKTVAKVARSSITVLITGESGTGKEIIARAIHRYSDRKNKPFVAVNCAALPANLLEAELFGYEKGAFTGAVSSKKGLFEQANGGTIFLDEIGELPLSLQAKLLRILQEKEVRPIGSERSKKIDVRVIAATNRNLEEEVKKGTFREDLYFRLNIVKIKLPPLRERKEDIVPLAHHFIKRFSKEFKLSPKELSADAVEFLLSYHFPGNVRELENMILRAMILSPSNLITAEDLKRQAYQEPPSLESLIREFVFRVFSVEQKEENNLYEIVVKAAEKAVISEVLKRCNFNQVKAAKLLGIHRNTLRKKIKELGIELS